MVEQTQNTQEQESGLLSKVLKVAAYPISAVAGLWSAKAGIESSTYDSLLFLHAIDDIRDPVVEEGRKKGVELSKKAAAGMTVDLHTETEPVFSKYRQDMQTRYERFSLGTLRQKWRHTQPHQRTGIIIQGVTGAGIALGTLLAVANSKPISHALAKHEQDKNPESQGMSK